MAKLNKQHAKKIISKLKGESSKTTCKHHDMYDIFNEDGEYLTSLGLSHSPKKDKGHGHIPDELGVSQKFAMEIGVCTKYRDDWLEEIAEG